MVAPWPQTTQLGGLLDAMQEDRGQVAVVISKVPKLRACLEAAMRTKRRVVKKTRIFLYELLPCPISMLDHRSFCQGQVSPWVPRPHRSRRPRRGAWLGCDPLFFEGEKIQQYPTGRGRWGGTYNKLLLNC